MLKHYFCACLHPRAILRNIRNILFKMYLPVIRENWSYFFILLYSMSVCRIVCPHRNKLPYFDYIFILLLSGPLRNSNFVFLISDEGQRSGVHRLGAPR